MKEYRQHRFVRPAGATEILLVRHGESRAAVPGKPFALIDGQGDPELANIGVEQAARVAARLKHLPIDSIYVTSLRRTHETAAPLAEALNIKPVVEADLREVHLGEWEAGIFRMKVSEGDPLYTVMQEEERWDAIPGAESHDAIRRRVAPAFKKIIDAHADQLIVLVLHGGIIGHILAEATDARPFAFNGCDNASISHVVVMNDKLILRGYNDISHLAGLESDNRPS